MKKTIILLLLLALSVFGAKANDGAFYAQGNQLIPITETEISVKKEILTINHVKMGGAFRDLYRVSVYYEFFNPGEAKDLLVGFEALNYSEGGITHPFIHDFKVVMNDKYLPFDVSRIFYPLDKDNRVQWGKMTNYYQNGRFNEPTKDMWRALEDKDSPYYVWDEDVPYYYVYHFNAHFNRGLNIIQHSYDFYGSELVGEEYMFDYVLTAANRWANNGIDDFTLEINMGDRESFSIAPTFYKEASEWTFTGKGKTSMRIDNPYFCEDCPMFHVQSGSVVYHKQHFHPEGELHISKPLNFIFFYGGDDLEFDSFEDILRHQYHNLSLLNLDRQFSFTAEQRRLLKNFPFAYRGYVFRTQSLQRYFESTDWYIPNPDYVDHIEEMSDKEKEWVEFWSK